MQVYTRLKNKKSSHSKILTFLLGIAMSPLAFCESQLPIERYHGIVLEKVIGGTAKLKPTDKVIHCEIKDSHPKIKEKLAEIAKLIESASKEKLVTSLHFMAQIPSIEIYATKVEFKDTQSQKPTTTRIMLMKDHETLQTRAGTAAEKLINIVHDICPNPEPPPPAKNAK